jgi:thymidylate synthase ThyX
MASPDSNFDLSHYVTSVTGNIYAITELVPTSIAAASLARFSRTPDGFRVLLEKEFKNRLPLPRPLSPPVPSQEGEEGGEKKEEEREIDLLRRVISQYGDDSVQQLASFYVVVEMASNVLTKILERGRIGLAYLEMSSRYIILDQKILFPGEDVPRSRFHIPSEIERNPRLLASYIEGMEEIFRLYSHAVRAAIERLSETSTVPQEKRDGAWRAAIRAQSCDLARNILPAATLANVGIHGSAQALENLIMHLRAHPLEEMQHTGDQILRELRKVGPVFFERADDPAKGQATTDYLAATRKGFVRDDRAGGDLLPGPPSVTLDYFYPECEYELRSPGFPLNADSQEEFEEKLFEYVGDRKDRRHRPGRALENFYYHFTVESAYAEFRDIQRHRIINDMEWTTLKPAGIEIPEQMKEFGLDFLFTQAHEVSQSLYTKLSTIDAPAPDSTPTGWAKQSPMLGQYATLFGSKMRWRFGMNLRQAMHMLELRTIPQAHPSYRKICQVMYYKILDVHPTLAKTIKFVGLDGAPELVRLESERKIQARLESLEKGERTRREEKSQQKK